MKSLASYLITMFTVMFWLFRVIVALTATLKIDIGIEPINLTYEVILLFVSLFAIVLIVKRNIIGALLYFASYLLYFGPELFTLVNNLIEGTLGAEQYLNLIIVGGAILLASATLLDILLNKERLNTGKSKQTDWYYKDATYDRQLDERADKNNYRTMQNLWETVIEISR